MSEQLIVTARSAIGHQFEQAHVRLNNKNKHEKNPDR
jgi:hypothetical protein